MEVHVLKAIWILLTTLMGVFGLMVNLCEEYLPAYILRTYHYGKHEYTGKKPLISPIEVPKRWFRHFYIFASVMSALSLLLTVSTSIYGYSVPYHVRLILDFLGTESRFTSVSPIGALLAVSLITAQCFRRCYETQCISIFSDAQINVAHYIVGYLHYFCLITSVLVEAPGFAAPGYEIIPNYLKWYQILAALFFIIGFLLQFQTAVIFANLRKLKTGSISTKHVIPTGGFFKYVSNPHYLGEIIMYLSLAIILWGNTCVTYAALWVLINQVESSLLSHWWYQSKFKDYPKERTAVFPFIL